MRAKRDFYPFVLLLFWTFVLSNIFKSSVPVPSEQSYRNKVMLFNFIPQGWGFFTRDPREDQVSYYKVDKATRRIERFTESNSGASSFFGASRKNRLKGFEMGMITAKINDSLWMREEGGNVFFLDDKILPDTIVNHFKPNNIEGDFFVVKQKRVPWAKKAENIVMPYQYVKIHVKAD